MHSLLLAFFSPVENTRLPLAGAATLSMSCSDKMAKWVLLGVQGALLSTLLAEPLHLDSVTIALPPEIWATARPQAAEAVQRALFGELNGADLLTYLRTKF